ncbi:MAG: hypothetical protein H6553_03325 [Chitinophagales bacterium]|nr:hypothetical protein [Chitinophagales bacterium]
MKTTTKIIAALLIVLIISCGKDNSTNTTTTVDLKGKIVPSNSMLKDGDVEFYDLRDANNPKKAAFNIVGTTADNIQLQYVKSRPIGANTIIANYGNLSINHNNEVYLADRNFPNWTNISNVGDWLIMNNDNTNQLYPSYQDDEGVTELYEYTTFFDDFQAIGNWANAGTINCNFEVYETYNSSYDTRNSFFINLKTQEYLFYYNINSSGGLFWGYKITDLIKKPNGNMDTDPIDWTKADFAIALSYTHSFSSITYNSKPVTLIIFVDLDTKTYAEFTRNKEDDAINGADKGRQTLLTTTWQPLNNLIKGWDL